MLHGKKGGGGFFNQDKLSNNRNLNFEVCLCGERIQESRLNWKSVCFKGGEGVKERKLSNYRNLNFEACYLSQKEALIETGGFLCYKSGKKGQEHKVLK